MNSIDYKEHFEKLARAYIKRDGIEDLLTMLSKTDFYTAPASTRFHDSVEQGLVYHSLKVFTYLRGDKDISKLNISEESVAICALFHDICKIGFYKVSTRNTKDENGKWIQVPYYEVDDKLPLGHSEKSVMLLQSYMKLTTDEILAINAHMGGFDDRKFIIGNTFDTCPLAVCLHVADLKASYLK